MRPSKKKKPLNDESRAARGLDRAGQLGHLTPTTYQKLIDHELTKLASPVTHIDPSTIDIEDLLQRARR